MSKNSIHIFYKALRAITKISQLMLFGERVAYYSENSKKYKSYMWVKRRVNVKVGAVCKYQHPYFRGFKEFGIFICGMLPTYVFIINETQSQNLLEESLWNTEVHCHIHETPPLDGCRPELCALSLHTHTHFLTACLMLSPIDIPSKLRACPAHRLWKQGT
jgi:hypothetical protein